MTEEEIQELEQEIGGRIVERIRRRLTALKKVPSISDSNDVDTLTAENIILRKRCNDLAKQFLLFSIKSDRRSFRSD